MARFSQFEKKIISYSIGGLFVFGKVALLLSHHRLPKFDLPVGQYSDYEINVTKEGYTITHRMHDPLLVEERLTKQLGKTETSKSFVASKKKVSRMTDREYLECVERRIKAKTTGEMVGVSVASGTGLISSLSQLPILGWFLGGVANDKSKSIGGQLGEQISGDPYDC